MNKKELALLTLLSTKIAGDALEPLLFHIENPYTDEPIKMNWSLRFEANAMTQTTSIFANARGAS
jgi:hypothetical protein